MWADIVREDVGEEAFFKLRGGRKGSQIRNPMAMLKFYCNQRREYDPDAAQVAAECERVFEVVRRLPSFRDPCIQKAHRSPD